MIFSNKENDDSEKVDNNSMSEKNKCIDGDKVISDTSQASCRITCSGSKRLSIESLPKDENISLRSHGKKLKLSLKAVQKQTLE